MCHLLSNKFGRYVMLDMLNKELFHKTYEQTLPNCCKESVVKFEKLCENIILSPPFIKWLSTYHVNHEF